MRNVVRAKMVCNPIDQAFNSAKTFASLPGYPPNNVSIMDGICILAPNWTDQVGLLHGFVTVNYVFGTIQSGVARMCSVSACSLPHVR